MLNLKNIELIVKDLKILFLIKKNNVLILEIKVHN